MTYRKEELITASEVARYVYCQRAWAYDRSGVRVRRRGLMRLLPSGRWLLIGVLVVLVLTVGAIVVVEMIGSA